MHIKQVAEKSYENAVNKGFFEEPVNIGEKLALIHAEVSEALECTRDISFIKEEIWYDGGTKPEGLPIELADVVLRVFNLCGYLGINIEEAIKIKHKYNCTRPVKHGRLY